MKKTIRNISNLICIEQQSVVKPKYFKISTDYKLLKQNVTNYLNEKKSSLYSEIVGKNSINPYPMIVSEKEWNEYRRIQEAIYYCIKCIVKNYNSDFHSFLGDLFFKLEKKTGHNYIASI